METSIAKTIQGKEAKINDWLAKAPAGSNKSFTYDPDMGNLGRGFERAPGGGVQPIAGPLEGVQIVLKSNGGGGYIIQSAFPIPLSKVIP
jgi:hypothetical protein